MSDLKAKVILKGLELGYGLENDKSVADEIISLCQPQWISVEDRLPDECVEVLVTQYKYMDEKKGRYQMIAYHIGDEWMADDNDETAESCFTPTHWQHLPETPEKA